MALSFKYAVEIPILFIFFSWMLSGFVTSNYIIYRTCYYTLGYNKSDCALLGTNNITEDIKKIEETVEPYANTINMVKTIMEVLVTVIFSLIFGPWSNKHGRKPILFSAFLGYFISYILLVIFSYLDWISPWYYLIPSLVPAFGGGLCSMLTVVFCYITDITSEERRGLRMAILEGCFSLGTLLGTLSSSYIFNLIGYTGIYIICSVILLLAVLYIVFVLEESLNNVENENKYADLLDLSVIVNCIKTTLKPRPNKNRSILILIMTMLMFYIFVIFSDSSMFFLYTRKKFSWSLEHYTLYSATNDLSDIVVSITILSIIYKLYKVHDMILILIGFIALCVASVIFGLATTDWMVYMGAGVKRLSCTIGPLARTALSKSVPPDDIGQIFSLMTSIETIVQAISTPLYTILYNTTISKNPGIFNFLSAGIYGFDVIIASTVIYLQRRYSYEEIRTH